MRLLRVATPESGARLAAALVSGALHGVTEPVLGVATGATPLGLYRELARRRAAGCGVRGRLRLVGLDEYDGLGPAHPDSFRAYIQREVAGPLGVDADDVHVPGATPGDDPGAGFESVLRRIGGVDLQVLGIGSNGHIAFNEPGSSLTSRTRVVRLAPQTRADNASAFASPDLVPRVAITQGIATILDARRLLLLAFGAQKADALARALHGPVDPDCPASAIRLHPDVTVIADRDALADLP